MQYIGDVEPNLTINGVPANEPTPPLGKGLDAAQKHAALEATKMRPA